MQWQILCLMPGHKLRFMNSISNLIEINSPSSLSKVTQNYSSIQMEHLMFLLLTLNLILGTMRPLYSSRSQYSLSNRVNIKGVIFYFHNKLKFETYFFQIAFINDGGLRSDIEKGTTKFFWRNKESIYFRNHNRRGCIKCSSI